jgi:two-component system chemotaxis response regulator CheY
MDKELFKVVYSNGQLPDPSGVDTSSIVEDLWEAYVDSSSSLLNELEGAAMDYEAGRDQDEKAASIRRILHTLKGEAGMTGVMDIHNLCHEAETAFDKITDQAVAADMVLKVKDWIVAAIEYACGKERTNVTDDFIDEQNNRDKSKIKTLVIEDDKVCSRRIESLLSDFCECYFAVDGKEGLERYCQSVQQNERFQLITLDINMPEMDGHETLEAIRKFEAENGIYGLDGVKIIMTTSQGTSEHVFSAFREGCEAYVVKSFMGQKLLDEMSKLGLLSSRKIYSLK